MSIAIRPAREDDRAALELILCQTFLADHVRYIPEAVDPEFVRSFTADLVGKRWPVMALGELDGAPVAMVYAEGCKIEAINVLPGFQRRGLGTALMDWIEERMDAGATASLDTQEANTPARSFYEGRGYRIERHWLQNRFTKTPIPMVALAKVL